MKKNKYLKFVDLGIAALALISLIMIFLPAVTGSVLGQSYDYNGLKVVFGYSEKSSFLGSTVTTEFLKFSFLNLLTYILVLGTIACAALSFMKGNKTVLLVAVAMAVVAGSFFLLTKNFVVLPTENANVIKAFKDNVSLGVGPIIGAICMYVAAGAGIAKAVLDK